MPQLLMIHVIDIPIYYTAVMLTYQLYLFDAQCICINMPVLSFLVSYACYDLFYVMFYFMKINLFLLQFTVIVQGDQKVSVYLMVTIQKVRSNVQSARRQSTDIY
jgi:hypothetical protein